MSLMRSSVLFLLYGIICCCVCVSSVWTGDLTQLQKAKQDQESLSPTTIPEDSPRENENVTVVDGSESYIKPSATPDDLHIIARRKCCEDGREHFYTNGNCANRPQKENEAVGLWCDRKFLECCSFMEAYYMGPVDGCRSKQCLSHQGSIAEDSPRKNEAENLSQSENVTAVNGSESQTKPDTTPEDLQIKARRKCCADGRQHFYTNGNCANRPQKENEAVGLWCDRKFLECCSFMEAYYMGPVDGCRNKHCNSRLSSSENLPENSPRENKTEKNENATVVDSHESHNNPDTTSATPGGDAVMTPTEDPQYIAKRRKCCNDGRQHFYKNGNCANRPQKENEAVGLWCDRKFMQCCSFMKEYYMEPVDGCRNRQCNSQLPSPTDTSHVTNKPLN